MKRIKVNMRKRFVIPGLAAGLTVCASLLIWSFAPHAKAQAGPDPEWTFIDSNCLFVAKASLPMPAREQLARFSLLMPTSALGGRPIPITVPVRINMFFDNYAADNLVTRMPVSIPVNLVLKPGELGTFDIGWTGSALVITRNGTERMTHDVPLVGDEVYISIAVESPLGTVRRNGRSQWFLPLGSTTIFHEGGTPETVISPRDAASGLPTG